ncbi:mechanosensitive ion channel domain-containing protein [Dinoroseobacter sp. S375]|uniref:mechanosensitive ion channel domain-containing protein n=1 Tax=Dinoroseobacter sp. S375 TaxID=3415136 RepID=UPI003C7E3E30
MPTTLPPVPQARPTDTFRAALLVFALALLAALWAVQAAAQSTFPIPGIGGSSTSEPAASDAPEPEPTPQDPTQALIDILQDDAARAALIAQLEQAAGESPPVDETQGGAGPRSAVSPSEVAPPTTTSTAPEGNFSTRLVHQLRTEVASDVRDFVARVNRIPTTLMLALRGFETEIILSVIRDLAEAVLISYAALIALRLATRPMLRALGRRAISANWFYRLILRLVGTAIITLAIPIAGVIGVTAVTFLMENGEGGATFSTAQTAFFAAFVLVETLKIPSRFVLTPRSRDLRLIAVGDKAARRMQRMLAFAIGLAGYGQLVAVPVVTAETSIFIGRAVSTLLGAVVILYLLIVVLRYRKAVAKWLTRNSEEDATLDEVLAFFAIRWHWPVLLYLGYLLTVVLTRPGNVLGPLAIDTVKVLAIIAAGGTATALARRATRRRVRLPQMVDSRLPLLAGRLNRLLPATLIVIRIGIVAVVVLGVLDVLGGFDLSGYLASAAGANFISALFGVAFATILVTLVYLAISSWVDYQLNPFVGTAPTPRMITLLTLLRNAVTIVLVIFGAMFTLSELGLNIGPLLASAGVLGLAISFGAQKLVEDIITGVFIQFENAMNVGDVVDVGGVVGAVEKLTVRSVTLRDVQGVVHMIPFSSASMISNYMREFSFYVCDMGVAYREDIEVSKQAMFDAFEELRADPEQGAFLLGDLEWFGLNSFGDSAIVLRARIKTQPGKQWGVGRAYNLILKRIFDERGIEIPFPHQTIYFGEDRKGKAPPVHVMMQTSSPEASQAHPVADAVPDASGPQVLDVPASDGDDPGR